MGDKKLEVTKVARNEQTENYLQKKINVRP